MKLQVLFSRLRSLSFVLLLQHIRHRDLSKTLVRRKEIDTPLDPRDVDLALHNINQASWMLDFCVWKSMLLWPRNKKCRVKLDSFPYPFVPIVPVDRDSFRARSPRCGPAVQVSLEVDLQTSQEGYGLRCVELGFADPRKALKLRSWISSKALKRVEGFLQARN